MTAARPPQPIGLPAAVATAAHVVARLGLVTAFGHVSARDGDRMVITPAADLAGVAAADVVAVPLDADALPPAAPPESWLHLAVYRRRADVGAMAAGTTPGAAVARLHLLDDACRVWLQARAAGDPQPLDADDVAAWRAAAPPLLDRLWAHLARSTTADAGTAQFPFPP